ncbi:hypothetical protein [Hyphobacterium sp.]|uniref:hypothetical protein n=1 Tax=Hyphobacterium sp. TaxID=2004662 RepID=UPI003BAB9277
MRAYQAIIGACSGRLLDFNLADRQANLSISLDLPKLSQRPVFTRFRWQGRRQRPFGGDLAFLSNS